MMMAGWIPPGSLVSTYPSGPSHIRSSSAAANPSTATPTRPSRASSSSALDTMKTLANAPGNSISSPLASSSYNDDEGSLSTIPDPRNRTMSPADGENLPTSSAPPDIEDEVATLSSKLINAINYQTSLEDTLNATRQELSSSKERIRGLEQEVAQHAEKIKSGALVHLSVVEAERTKHLASLAEEKKQRGIAEKDKKGMEKELENLTQALFEEANKLVVTAKEEANKLLVATKEEANKLLVATKQEANRLLVATKEEAKKEQDILQRKAVTAKEEAKKENDILQRRNDQLKAQLADMDNLLRSHQEQLAELKLVMEQMGENDDQTNPTAPSSPGASRIDGRNDEFPDPLHSASVVGFAPSYPTSFTHLLRPILRSDVAAYDDFASLLRTSKLFSPGSRASSGSYNGVGLGLGLGGHTGSSQPGVVTTQAHPNGSASSLTAPAAASSHPVSPTTPGSITSLGSAGEPGSALALKETRFYKRALAEDIEPTLRLDTAPGLSWLVRRTVLNAMCEGNLVVEPMPSPVSKVQRTYVYACSLCGENRKDKEHERTHRFRTSESGSAQRYPLCGFCLGRVRSTCDFLAFLRMLKDGHWRTDDEESEKAAWEESVRLREQMFWCRMGGGVVPVGAGLPLNGETKSPRSSQETDAMKVLKGEVDRTGEIHPRDITPIAGPAIAVNKEAMPAENEASLAKRSASKTGAGDDTAEGLWAAAQDDAAEPDKEEKEGSEETKRDSSQSLTPSEKEEKRLSITIPEP